MRLPMIIEAEARAREALSRTVSLWATMESQRHEILNGPAGKALRDMEAIAAGVRQFDVALSAATRSIRVDSRLASMTWEADHVHRAFRGTDIAWVTAENARLMRERFACLDPTQFAMLGSSTLTMPPAVSEAVQVMASLPSHDVLASMRGLSADVRKMIGPSVIPDYLTARRYLSSIDFALLDTSLGIPRSHALRDNLLDTARYFDAHVTTVLRDISALTRPARARLKRRLVHEGRALKFSTEAGVGLEVNRSAEPLPDLAPDLHVLGLLRALNPEFVDMYLGAVEAYNARNHDSARHVAVSLRELLNHVISHLAARDAVTQTGSGTSPSHVRRTRITYIFRAASTKETRYINAQVDYIMSLHEALNGPTHGTRFSRSVRSYVRALESVVMTMVEVAGIHRSER